MIPRTFPSTFALNGQQQMVVHFLTSVEGLERWSDYIPVKLEQGGPENSYSGCIDVVAISELTADTQAWKEYIPVHVDDEATDTWTVNNVGYIPYNFALFAEAAMQLDLTNGADLDYRVTFNRTTNATVTGPDGLIAYAEHNLLLFSESFDNAFYAKVNTTVTANATIAPNGTLTADLIIDNTANAVHSAVTSATITTSAHTLSVYAKNNTRRYLSLRVNDAATNANAAAVVFDLQVGVVSQTATAYGLFSEATGTITSVSNGWYRLTLTFTSNATSVGVKYELNDGSALSATGQSVYAGNGSSLYLWGAQLEQSSTAREYYPTTVKNLLGFTEHFDNAAWTKSNSSISATKVDDIYGEPFAQKLVENTANTSHFVASADAASVVGSTYTASVYAKAAERSVFRISRSGGAVGVGFNLTTQQIIAASGATGTITDVGNEWYRCTMTFSAVAVSQAIYVELQTAFNSSNQIYTGDGTSGIFIFGAQLSDSASVDPYVYQPVAAPASTAYYGPRFDYDPVTLAPKGLLIEEQRTNLLLRSEEFDNVSWNRLNIIVTANTSETVDPSGLFTAEKITGSSPSIDNKRLAQSVTLTAVSFVYTVYAKASDQSFLQLRTFAVFGLIHANFDISNGIVGDSAGVTSASILAVGNGWYRCQIVFTPIATTSDISLNFITALNSPNIEATSLTTSFYLWGASLEQGAFPTSYIPTSASQVTRAADNASMIGNNFARWYNAAEGTLYAESSNLSPLTIVVLLTDDNSNQTFNRIQLLSRQSGVSGVPAIVSHNNVLQSDAFVAYTGAAINKIALSYRINNLSVSANGSAPVTDTSALIPALTRLRLGVVAAPDDFVSNQRIKKVSYYPVRVTNEQLQRLTS